jgi:hypothetical protein
VTTTVADVCSVGLGGDPAVQVVWMVPVTWTLTAVSVPGDSGE